MPINFNELLQQRPPAKPKLKIPLLQGTTGTGDDWSGMQKRYQDKLLEMKGQPTLPQPGQINVPSPFRPGGIYTKKSPSEKAYAEMNIPAPLPLSSFLSPGYWLRTIGNVPADIKEFASGITSFISVVGSAVVDPNVRKKLFSAQTLKDVWKSLGDEYSQYLKDPAGKVQRDPFSFAVDLGTLFSFGAGAVTKVGNVTKNARILALGEGMRPLKLISTGYEGFTNVAKRFSPVFGEMLESTPKMAKSLGQYITKVRIRDIDDFRENLAAKLTQVAGGLTPEERTVANLVLRNMTTEALELSGGKIPSKIVPFVKFARRHGEQLEQSKILLRYFPDNVHLENAKWKEFANRRGLIKSMEEPLTASALKKAKALALKEQTEAIAKGVMPKELKGLPTYEQLVTRDAAEKAGIFTVGKGRAGVKVLPAWTHKKTGDISQLTPDELAKTFVLEKPDYFIYKQSMFLQHEKATRKFIDILEKNGVIRPQFYISPRGKRVEEGVVTVGGKKIALEGGAVMVGKIHFVPAYFHRMYRDNAALNQAFIDDAIKFGGEFEKIIGKSSKTSEALAKIDSDAKEFFKWFSGKSKEAPTESVLGMAREGVVVYSMPNNPVTYAVLEEMGRHAPSLTPFAFQNTFDAFTQIWKVGVLAFSPSWYIGNLVGSFILNLFEGVGLDDYAKAMLKNIKVHIPVEASAGGFAKSVFTSKPKYVRDLTRGLAERTVVDALKDNPLYRVMDTVAVKLFNINAVIEGVMRRALWVNKAEKLARAKVVGKAGRSFLSDLSLFNRKYSSEELIKIASKDKKMSGVISDIISATHNNYKALSIFEKRYFRRAFPFYNWWKFITTFTLTSPAKRPYPMLALNALSDFGRDVREDFWLSYGIDPNDLDDWERELIPIGARKDSTGKEYVLAIGSRNVNPFISVQLLGLAQANPLIALGAEWALGKDVFTGRELTYGDLEKNFIDGKYYKIEPGTNRVVPVGNMHPNLFYRLLTKFPVVGVLDKINKPYARYTATGKIIIDEETGNPAYGFGEEEREILREAGRRFGIASEPLYPKQIEKKRKRAETITKQYLERMSDEEKIKFIQERFNK